MYIPDIDVPIFDYTWDFILKNKKKMAKLSVLVYLILWDFIYKNNRSSKTRCMISDLLDFIVKNYRNGKTCQLQMGKRHVIINMCLSWIFLETYDQAPVLCLFQAAVHKPLHPADPVNIKQQDACTYNYIYNHRKWSI